MPLTVNEGPVSNQVRCPPNSAAWKEVVSKYQQPSLWRSVYQLVNSFVPYGLLWYLAYRSLALSYLISVPLVILAAGFLMRLFIIQHDCGHGSFFRSQRANDIVGFITGVLTLTPYHFWRWEHAVHHAGSGDLDRRTLGAVWTLTVQEYLDAPLWKRILYRLVRNPFVLLVFVPSILFLILHRFASTRASRRDRLSVYWTNLAIVALAVVLSLLMSLKAYLTIHFSIMAVSGTVGVWLFYVQHQFEGVNWQRHREWDYTSAALEGSSYYKLPRILQWFSGNIGFHHIHHLSPRIPNYYLEKCHNHDPLFQRVVTLTLTSSLKSLRHQLWDEAHHRLVGFRYLRTFRRRHRSEDYPRDCAGVG
ncbi:MAG TPA: fatty acid desaturase [Terriglobia bacterium]|nr:fatty acid desaturase [Terriglobia bacterium]